MLNGMDPVKLAPIVQNSTDTIFYTQKLIIHKII